jgi:radical SAM superfamily enzyme YgiQ (UPF0313 family)
MTIKQDDRTILDTQEAWGEAWFELLSAFQAGRRELVPLKKYSTDGFIHPISSVPFKDMLKNAIETRPFSKKALSSQINLSFPDENREEIYYRLLEMAYQFFYEDGIPEAIEYYIHVSNAAFYAEGDGITLEEEIALIKSYYSEEVLAAIKAQCPDLP